MTFPSRIVAALMAAAALVGAPLPASGAEFSVNSLSDIDDYKPGDGYCSIKSPLITPRRCTLRAAVQEANTVAGPDTILLQSGSYVLTIGGTGEDAAATGDLDIIDNLVIRGLDADSTIIDASGLDRVFDLHGPITVTLEKLAVTGGRALDDAATYGGLGGGILITNGALLRLSEIRVSRNAARFGGGIGALTTDEIEIVGSDISHNQVILGDGAWTVGGAALWFDGSGYSDFVEVLASTFASNGCVNAAEASCLPAMLLSNCGDQINSGLLLRNSTISSNETTGLAFRGCYGALENATIYGNTGYGISVDDSSTPARTVRARNTIFAHNGAGDCDLQAGDWDFTLGHNLSSDDSCDLNPYAMDKVNTDPELLPLGTYPPVAPSFTLTHHPRWGSPVVDTGGVLASVTTDQENFPRPMDGNQNVLEYYDMGAIEVLPCLAPENTTVANETVTTGIRWACDRLTVGPNVIVTGAPVEFQARGAIIINGSFEVRAGARLFMKLSRTASY